MEKGFEALRRAPGHGRTSSAGTDFRPLFTNLLWMTGQTCVLPGVVSTEDQKGRGSRH